MTGPRCSAGRPAPTRPRSERTRRLRSPGPGRCGRFHPEPGHEGHPGDRRVDVEADRVHLGSGQGRHRARLRGASTSTRATRSSAPRRAVARRVTEDCELLYFGADRFSNSGDTVMGFWFFRTSVGRSAPTRRERHVQRHPHCTRKRRTGSLRYRAATSSSSATSGRAARHRTSRSTSGWPRAEAPPRTWTRSAAVPHRRPARRLRASRAERSAGPAGGDNDNFCATSNQFIVTSPWPYLAKDNSGGTSWRQRCGTKFGVATFMEGGINLTALGFGDTCFSSFMAETRASHSVTSTLSDFVLSGFGACTSGSRRRRRTAAERTSPTATFRRTGCPTSRSGPAVPASTSPTTPASPSAGITTWTGTVKFFICGPIASGTCDTAALRLAPRTSATPSLTATSDVVKLTSVGRYCWRGLFESPDGWRPGFDRCLHRRVLRGEAGQADPRHGGPRRRSTSARRSRTTPRSGTRRTSPAPTVARLLAWPAASTRRSTRRPAPRRAGRSPSPC